MTIMQTNPRHHLIPSRDIDEQRTLQSVWTKGIPNHIQPKNSLRCNLPLMIIPCKKSKISLDSFQRYWCSTILQSDWTWGKTGQSQLKVVVADAIFPLWLRILQSDWTKGTTGLNQPKLLVLDASFPWWLTPCKKNLRYQLVFFLEILVIKESYIWLDKWQN